MALLALLVALLSSSVLGLDNGLGKLPGMGWNSDYCTNCSSSDVNVNGFHGPKTETFIRHIADYLNKSGLQKLGYRYVNMDATWGE